MMTCVRITRELLGRVGQSVILETPPFAPIHLVQGISFERGEWLASISNGIRIKSARVQDTASGTIKLEACVLKT